MLHFSLSRHFTRRPFCSVNCRFAGYKSSLNNPVFPYGISLSSQQQSRSLLPCSKSEHSEQFILHDGPPYANGEIHLGHALNKILKDITVRFEKLRGKDCSFIPGWDCHGLPIELSAMGVDLSLPPNQIRSASLTWATKCMQSQRLAFGEFNLLVDWSSVYSTLDLSYQSVVLKAFRDLCLKGYLVREPKPVYWSPRTNCAISESELEYNSEHESVSLYFLVKLHCSLLSTPDRFRFYPTFIVVWTTTPWTIVANEAIVFNPSERYSILLDETNKRLLVVSAAFVDFLSFLGGCRSYRRIADLPTGAVLQDCAYAHPLRSSSGKYFLRAADFVVNKGTGFVHVAPAHGRDDFDFAKRHNLPLKNYVDEKACFTKDAGQELAGLSVQPEGTAAIIKLLGEHVLSTKKMRHSFPYEWRTNKPVITRLSEQWFIDTDKLCEPAKMAYATVKVFPPDLKSCMIPFIENRPFWCISRQRIWGVPIPVLYRKGTLSPIVDPEFITSIADRVSAEGSEFWWSEPIDTMVPKSFLNKWSLSPKEIVKGTDIFDVWFESGLSWRAVLPIDCVADVYLEGYDQFRGWFSSSLLLGVALTGQAPFKTLVVHGFTTDAEGRKMSKSLGNVLAPKDLLKLTDNCSDVLRRWAAASGLSTHSSVSTKEFIDHATSYKKLRNAFRFMLGNLHDFTPDAAFSGTTADDLFHFLLGRLRTKPPVNFCVLDTWALCLVGTFMDSVLNSYFPNFKFETIIAELDRLVSRLSATYFNSVKDRCISNI
uniref:isoleucine--tRNA ligase n=3 Tax=Schistocephalus solidus TaxID=70667 RepID=A0A0X3PG37_SCHSO